MASKIKVLPVGANPAEGWYRSMSHAGNTIVVTHDLRLVLFSVVIAILASYTALELAGRLTTAHQAPISELAGGRVALRSWLIGGAFAMGIGVWSMHLIGMLDYRLAVPVTASLVLLGIALLAFRIEQRIITETAKAEALCQSEERFRSLVQNSSDIITILEVDGTIRYESPSIERILGYKPEDLLGKNAFVFIHPEEVQKAGSVLDLRMSCHMARPNS